MKGVLNNKPGYLELSRDELYGRAEKAKARLASCDLCPNNCGVNRTEGQVGQCKAGYMPKVASANLHTGEEPPISGTRGSGTIFFSHCTLSCVYCQNWPISQKGNGRQTSIDGLADMMLGLQARGAHNVNFVTPTHYMPQILEALVVAVDGGFCLPIVYNTSGYEVVPALRLLDGIVDVYLPDMRYACDKQAKRYSKARMYSMYNRAAIKEMYRQAGNLVTGEDGIAQRGLIIRHLVLPGGVSGTDEIMKFLAREISTGVHISLMSQYFPAFMADTMPELAGKLTEVEYQAARDAMEGYGLAEGWVQEIENG